MLFEGGVLVFCWVWIGDFFVDGLSKVFEFRC